MFDSNLKLLANGRMNRWRAKIGLLTLLGMFFLRAVPLTSVALAATTAVPIKSPSKSTAKVSKTKVKPKAKKKPVDYNAPGVAAFQKKNFREALRLFGIATKNDPKNPMSWLNHARAIIAVYGADEPENYCDSETNWIFDALSSLTRAAELGSAKVLPVLASVKDANFPKFRSRPEFKNWDLIRTLPLKTDLATQDFFAKHNDWLIENQPNPATVVTFAPSHELTIAAADGTRDTGTWSAGADRVVIKTKMEMRTLNLTTSKYPFGSAGKSFRIVVLQDPSKPEAWSMGPEIADCPKP